MIRALLFDMGGTLDADGVHWIDRFAGAYEACGVRVAPQALGAAFDDAERRAASDEQMETAPLEAMVARHVDWQLESLKRDPAAAADLDRAGAGGSLSVRLVKGFVEPVRQIASRNRRLLEDLKSRGYLLGVLSNGCGNVDVLCDDLGFAPSLSLIVDSRRVGLRKPDPDIYLYAAARWGLPPSAIMMIGDSFDRDVRPAASIGMRTAWIQGAPSSMCPDPALVDIRLSALTQLPSALDAYVQTVA